MTIELYVTAWHCKQQLGETRRFQLLQLVQTLIFFSRNDDDGRLAVLSHGLRLAAGGFDHLAEPVLGILYRPCRMSHQHIT